uniref:1-phosphatidylinositol 4-kinase n=1 Tax=Kalanchoe fedtschenkoi TaxID=63787 RepID=A0A7N0ZUV1_KALFE
MAVAVDPHFGFKPFARSQRCKLQSFTQLDFSMLENGQPNVAYSLKQAIDVENFHKSFSTPCLSHGRSVEDDFDAVTPRIQIVCGNGAPKVRALVVDVAISVASGVEPIPVSSGLGGAYMLRSKNGDKIAVAKPIDEEPLAFNNPKGFVGRMFGQFGLKRSVRVGETGVREVAAYLLDYESFAGVPATALVKFSHLRFHVSDLEAFPAPPCKIASLQRFVEHDFDAGELGPSSFSVASVHRIGILDIRILNLDRHTGNLLVKKCEQDNEAVGAVELVPIDHGFCLPEWLDDPYFEWMHWPQAAVPFSELELEYISNLEPYKDAEMLRSELPSVREPCLRVMILCTIFLKRAAAAGLCLADIGIMMSREISGGEEKPSVLEKVCAEANASRSKLCFDSDDRSECPEVDENDNEETEMFSFENECDLSSSAPVLDPPYNNNPIGNVKPPKFPRFSSAKSLDRLPDYELATTLQEKDGAACSIISNSIDDDSTADTRCLSVTRSKSFALKSHSYECEGISFEELSECEWQSFLTAFEELLPEFFEETRGSGLKKNRLGTSCEF